MVSISIYSKCFSAKNNAEHLYPEVQHVNNLVGSSELPSDKESVFTEDAYFQKNLRV